MAIHQVVVPVSESLILSAVEKTLISGQLPSFSHTVGVVSVDTTGCGRLVG